MNPLGQLPTFLTPGGEVLTQSVAILWTRTEQHPSFAVLIASIDALPAAAPISKRHWT